MKNLKYIFVFFFLSILNFRIYSTTTTIINNIYINDVINLPTDNVSLEDNYKPHDENFWKHEASKTDDTYSFWYWLSNVSVLTSGLFCGLSFFLFTEWFYILVIIFGLLYILNFFVQISSPTSQCLLKFETKENFERYTRQNKPKIESVVTYEHEYTEKNSKGEEKIKKELIKTESDNVSFLTFNVSIDYKNENQNMIGTSSDKPLKKYKIDLSIHREGSFLSRSNQNTIFKEKIAKFQPCCKEKKHRIKRDVYWSVPNIGNYMLVADDKSLKPWHVSFGWFLLFTILPFSQLYKLWVNRYCAEVVCGIKYTIGC